MRYRSGYAKRREVSLEVPSSVRKSTAAFLVQLSQPFTQSSGDFITHPAKRLQLFLFGSLDGGRVIKGPVEPFAHSWENLRAIPLGVLAHNNQIMGGNLAEKLLHALGALPGNVNSNLPHDWFDQRMDTARIQTGAVDVKSVAHRLAQKALGHLAASGVPSAEDEEAFSLVHGSLPFGN